MFSLAGVSQIQMRSAIQFREEAREEEEED